MGYSTRTERTKTGKFAARVMTGAYGRGYTIHLTEEFSTAGEAYEAATTWQKEQAARNKAAKEEKNKAQMTCQCCGRKHLANTGKIAHHGYQRPGGGWQTASCAGARQLPFEVSREWLGKIINDMRSQKAAMIDSRAAVEAETNGFTIVATDYSQPRNVRNGKRPTIYIKVTRDTFEAVKEANSKALQNTTFDEAKATELRVSASNIKNIGDFINDCQTRYDGWKQTHKSFDKKAGQWEKI